MRKTIILLFAFFAISVTSYASSSADDNTIEAYYNRLADLNRSFKMTGGTSITCFAKALSKYLPFDEKEDAESIDNANGYIHVFTEGDGLYSVEYAVWKCSDGKRLYIVSYYINETVGTGDLVKPGKCSATHYSGIIYLTEDGKYRAVANAGCQAYLYNAQTKTLEPIKFPADRLKKPSRGITPIYQFTLPQKGKNIKVQIGTNIENREEFQLVWNGKNGFICK
ncbi:MAG: hypothetical protein HUK08_09375 [Bacteroidaceae bacterium]|nr:hypothetical protein [Bacteroidaceae bacterium]